MIAVYASLSALGALLLFVYVTALLRSRSWQQGGKEPPLRGLGLPEGSIRGLIAFLVIGAFVIFVFFGRQALGEGDNGNELYTTVLTAFGTLTGAIAGFYFGGRGSGGSNASQ